MYRATLPKDLAKVRRRLVFEEKRTVQTEDVVSENSLLVSNSNSMAQAFVDTKQDVVFFLGYRSSPIQKTPYYCADCIDSVLGFELKAPLEYQYISTGEKPLTQFTSEDFRDKSNYCAQCRVPLYDLKHVDEQCQHSKPSSSKQRQHFRQRKRSGLQHGGS